MRIGFDVSKALMPHDGIGRYTLELLQALALLAGDHELWLYDLYQDGARPVDEGSLREALGQWPANLRLRPGRPERDPLDVVHSITWVHPAVSGVPVLFTCHDLTFLTHPACHTLANKIHCTTGILRAHLLGAEFLAVSRATAGELRAQLGVAEERIHVVYSAAAPRFRRLAADDARRRVAERFGVGEPYVLAVGTLEPRKNLRRLLDAYARLPAALREAHPLLIAGAQGWGSGTVGELIAERSELGTAHLLGRVSDDQLVALYNAAAVFAFPSLAEGFGLPVVEAMACGAPVLTSDRSATAEVGAGAALLVDPEDPAAIERGLRQLLADPRERDRLRGLGAERAAAFSWEKTARETLELYRQLADRRA